MMVASAILVIYSYSPFEWCKPHRCAAPSRLGFPLVISRCPRPRFTSGLRTLSNIVSKRLPIASQWESFPVLFGPSRKVASKALNTSMCLDKNMTSGISQRKIPFDNPQRSTDLRMSRYLSEALKVSGAGPRSAYNTNLHLPTSHAISFILSRRP
ncbi:hypothetical protein BD309DRAFT_993171 [Dichomitus squalens]|uniref:Uncharacterized protein n=1 Tax=Dichomitus squalens (strain LYAD-421) TaxID=732165 RepID=R7SNH2_DICSQ|nr:uncharacterized protein DICSQDRAFT_157455 [Dichomitus squalens LYAD-421 SS1]EJF57255.1 hypothetical protein DICSQDRAFT_157455 [Dichomitus squalens LYAD-421 SS1]TBU40309.1 hypothetical protein BD309DRAFT_993171 [Dichomitus squalens]